VIDLHCHVLPGIDDGVRTIDESIDLIAAAAAEGVRTIAATPHVRSDYPTTVEAMEAAVAEVRRAIDAAGLEVALLHGGELDVLELARRGDEELARFALGRGSCALLECPYQGWPLAFDSAIARLRSLGLVPLVAHPERNPTIQEDPRLLAGLVADGACIQITAASLDGRAGRAAARTARRLLDLGLVHVLATDSHAPDVRAGGFAAALATLDPGLTQYLTVEAPAALISGVRPGPPPRRPRRQLRFRFIDRR
jgi:protein-tyrosine phosphatase